MFTNVFESILNHQYIPESYGMSAFEVQAIYNDCLAQGVDEYESISETELLCNISHLVVHNGHVASFRTR